MCVFQPVASGCSCRCYCWKQKLQKAKQSQLMTSRRRPHIRYRWWRWRKGWGAAARWAGLRLLRRAHMEMENRRRSGSSLKHKRRKTWNSRAVLGDLIMCKPLSAIFMCTFGLLKHVIFITCGRSSCSEQNRRDPKQKVDKGSRKAGDLCCGWRRRCQRPLVKTLKWQTPARLKQKTVLRQTWFPITPLVKFKG